MAPLDRAGGAVGVEERDALAALMAAARIGDPVAAGGAKSPAQRPADGVTVGVERIDKRAGAVPEIMGVQADIEHDPPELTPEKRRVGKECFTTCRMRWSTNHY